MVTQRNSAAMERTLEHALVERSWDAVVFDSICAGWALRHVRRHRARSARPPRIVYIAHNHEVTVARRIAAASQGLRRILKEIDFLKVIGLERRLISAADIVTSNTPDDCRRFAVGSGGRPIVFLPPGYGGPRIASRKIDAGVPRRAILVGSLDWPPKRISLESFLAAATKPLLRAGIELQIVGEVEGDYLADLRRRFPSVDFVGPVTDVRPYMQDARVALVPDLLGGFKLKGLDYVFNRLPILAMRIALPGMPLEDGRSIGLFDSHSALAEGVVALIDDFADLNARQERAYAACADCFDWDRIGRHLMAHIRGTTDRQVRAGTVAPTSDAVSQPVRLAAGR
jgi:glycosyltransferase involved in cell wall biosynthesis